MPDGPSPILHPEGVLSCQCWGAGRSRSGPPQVGRGWSLLSGGWSSRLRQGGPSGTGCPPSGPLSSVPPLSPCPGADLGSPSGLLLFGEAPLLSEGEMYADEIEDDRFPGPLVRVLQGRDTKFAPSPRVNEHGVGSEPSVDVVVGAACLWGSWAGRVHVGRGIIKQHTSVRGPGPVVTWDSGAPGASD